MSLLNFLSSTTKWGKFNKSLLDEASKKNWGAYRCIRFDMAEFLKKEGKLEQSLETYLEVLYLDQNGADSKFDPEMAFIAPGVIGRAGLLIKKFKITFDEVKQIFLQHNQRVEKSLKLPIKPDNAWEKIEPELEKFLVKVESKK